MSVNKSSTLCVLPWIHMNIQPNGDIYPCCMAPYGEPIGNTKDNTLEEVWNGEDMKNIRKEMLQGKRPHLCSRCYLIEDGGLGSPRGTHTREFEHVLEEAIANTNIETGEYKDFKLKYWDFRWSNICNFKCRMCGTYSSSKWSEDGYALYGEHSKIEGVIEYNPESKEDIFNYVDRFINDVEEIYFAGGEPLIMDEHYIILEKLIAAGRTDVKLRYNTNISHIKFKKWNLLELWSKFIENDKSRIQIFASLDAVGKLAEVIRNGTKWNKVYLNLQELQKLGVELHFAPTISILNIFFVDELIDLCNDLNIHPNQIGMSNFLTTPEFYDARLLPEDLKKKLIHKLENYKNTKCPEKYKPALHYGLEGWKNFLSLDFPADRLENEKWLYRATKLLDNRRQENFIEVNPQYKEWLEEIEGKIPNVEEFVKPYEKISNV